MSPRNDVSNDPSEKSPLFINEGRAEPTTHESDSFSYMSYSQENNSNLSFAESEQKYDPQYHFCSKLLCSVLISSLVAVILCTSHVTFTDQENVPSNNTGNNTTLQNIDTNSSSILNGTGQYKLIQRQEGKAFLDFYTFYEGSDSPGSAGYNEYVSKEEATKLGIVGLKKDPLTEENLVFMKSAPTLDGPRSSIRIEGKTDFDRGLFILDVRKMPNGDGVWPAFWLTVS